MPCNQITPLHKYIIAYIGFKRAAAHSLWTSRAFFPPAVINLNSALRSLQSGAAPWSPLRAIASQNLLCAKAAASFASAQRYNASKSCSSTSFGWGKQNLYHLPTGPNHHFFCMKNVHLTCKKVFLLWFTLVS